MYEAIVTLCFPPTKEEPAHTVVRRIEFENETDMQAWYLSGIDNSVNDEELRAR
jgi:hypothetical protein